jgi:DNA-directed RNA polymerase subunit RPC12/RpoP
MLACTRCGRWHIAAEEALGRRLTCTEVKRFWFDMRQRHREHYGHAAQIVAGPSDAYICVRCGRPLIE